MSSGKGTNDGYGRSGEFRYTVAHQGADITPMASVEVYLGTLSVQVLNVSQGGLALLFAREPRVAVGDILEASASIRDRAFPVKIEVKAVKGFRVSCAFVNPSKIFVGSLREFLKPKFLGASLKKVEREGAVGSDDPTIFSGLNRVGVFVWTQLDGSLRKLVASSADLAFEWTAAGGIRTGRLAPQAQESWELEHLATDPLWLNTDSAQASDRIKWDRVAETTMLHYFADIFLAWLDFSDGPKFVEELMNSEAGQNSERVLKFPVR